MKPSYDQIYTKRADFFVALLEAFKPEGQWKAVEIGVFTGEFTVYLCKATDKWQSIVGVDPYVCYSQMKRKEPQSAWDAVYETARARLSTYESVRLIRMKSDDAFEGFPDAFLDFLFIDGDHSHDQVLRDISQWECKVAPGGIVSGHDFTGAKHPGLVKAVQSYALVNKRNLVIPQFDKLWYWKR